VGYTWAMPDGPATSTVDVSVVLPTYRRPDSLRRLLASIAAQEDPGLSWEVIVVDNESPPTADDVVESVRPDFRAPLRCVWEATAGSAHARNRGIAEAQGAITVLVDDDVVVDPAWLRELVAPIAAGDCEGTGGRVLLEHPARLPGWFDHEGLRGYLTHYDLGDEVVELGPQDYLVTASAAFRTDLLRATGGFDAALGPTGAGHLVGDDALVHRRVLAAGGRVRYVPSAIAVHELPPARLSPRYLLRRAHDQGRSDWILNRAALEPMRGHGLRVALLELRDEARARRHEGLRRPGVAFHLVTDLVRFAGNLRQIVAWELERRGRGPGSG
jgi:GT2 family glycosyltransferase